MGQSEFFRNSYPATIFSIIKLNDKKKQQQKKKKLLTDSCALSQFFWM